MSVGPFEIRVSKYAELVDLTTLPEEKQHILSGYKIYVITVSMEEVKSFAKKRTRRRRAYSVADHVFVQLRKSSETSAIDLAIVSPTTQPINGHHDKIFQGKQILEFRTIRPNGRKKKTCQLRTAKKFKNIITKKHYRVCASSIDGCAQWVFIRQQADLQDGFLLKVYFLLPTITEVQMRKVLCDVTVSERGRVLKHIYGRPVSVNSNYQG